MAGLCIRHCYRLRAVNLSVKIEQSGAYILSRMSSLFNVARLKRFFNNENRPVALTDFGHLRRKRRQTELVIADRYKRQRELMSADH